MAGEKKEEITNCAQCNKHFNMATRYYRDGKYYCNKRCWKVRKKKLEEDRIKAQEEAEEKAKAEAEAKAQEEVKAQEDTQAKEETKPAEVEEPPKEEA